MNGRRDRKSRIIRIVVDLCLEIVAVYLLIWLKFVKNYKGDWIPVLYFAVILITSKLFYDLHGYTERYAVKTHRRFRRVFRFIFRPFLSKIEKKKEEKKKYLKGHTERSFIFRRGRSGKKPRFDTRIKANLKKCRTNSEKLRMMYIRGVLELRDRGCDVTPSKTVRELERMLPKDGNRTLFHTYAKMRYEKDFSVDDETLKQCGDKN